jgi:flagellar hook-length control protein FliK
MEISPTLPATPASPRGAAAGDDAGAPGAGQAEAAASAEDFAGLLAGDLAALSGIAVPGGQPATAAAIDSLALPVEDASTGAAGDPTVGFVLAAIAFQGAPPPGTANAAPAQESPGALRGGSAAAGRGESIPPALPAAAGTGEPVRPGGGLDVLAATPAKPAPLDALPTPEVPPQVTPQPMSTEGTARAAAPVAAHAEIRAPLQSPGWGNELGRVTLWMHNERHQVAELRLNPPELGPLQITLRLGGDDGAQAQLSFAAPHSETRAALEAALPRLREMLAESGISLGQATVSAESFAGSGQDARAPQRERDARDAASAPGATDAGAAPLTLRLRENAGLVDIFA